MEKIKRICSVNELPVNPSHILNTRGEFTALYSPDKAKLFQTKRVSVAACEAASERNKLQEIFDCSIVMVSFTV